MKKSLLLAFIFIILTNSYCFAGHKHREKYYQKKWCIWHDGQIEVVMPDRSTRCDCVTSKYAVEVDFGKKFYEAIGQSLYYSFQTNKKAGILLIIEDPQDMKYWVRLNSVIQHFNLPIKSWIISN